MVIRCTNQQEDFMRFIVCGDRGEVGKDLVCQQMEDEFGLRYESSSWAARFAVWNESALIRGQFLREVQFLQGEYLAGMPDHMGIAEAVLQAGHGLCEEVRVTAHVQHRRLNKPALEPVCGATR